MHLSSDDVAQIIQEVWSSMLGIDVEPVDMTRPETNDAVAGSVGVTGATDCLISMEMGGPGARRFAATMFGMSDEEASDDDIADGIGELTNMVGGNIKSLLPEPSTLSLPVVAQGKSPTLRVPGGKPLLEAGYMADGFPMFLTVWSPRSECAALASDSVTDGPNDQPCVISLTNPESETTVKVVVADDSRAMRMIVVRTLRQAGYDGADIIECEDGAEGLAAVKANSPDMVLSDWNMPNMSGIEFLQALRADGNQVPFGFVTSEGSDAMRSQASEHGALFLIAKPFTADMFSEALKPVLG